MKVCVFLGLARTIYIQGVYTVFLAGKSPCIRSLYLLLFLFQRESMCLGASTLKHNVHAGGIRVGYCCGGSDG